MVDIPLVALAVDPPSAQDPFFAGVNQAQGRRMNSLQMRAAEQNMRNADLEAQRKHAEMMFGLIGSVGMGAMGGRIDGDPNPEQWTQGLDFVDRMYPGLNAAQFKDRPDLAPIAARASMGALEQVRAAQNEEQLFQAGDRFELELEKLSQREAPKPLSAAGKLSADRQAGFIDEETYQSERAGARKPNLTATELKAIYAAEDELPNLDSSISQLERALELNDRSYSGFGAATRGMLGSKVGDDWMPDFIANPEAGKATSEYSGIMTGEAANAMSAALKGATTDKELSIFMDIISDVSKPPEVRKNAINRLLSLAKAKKATAVQRIQELRGGGSAAPASIGGATGPNHKEVNGVLYEQDDSGDWFEAD